MLCFSGIGGTMRVGCRFTSVWRNDANSEYRRRTSRSYLSDISLVRSLLCTSTYRCPNCIDDEASPAFMVLAGICYENRHFRVLVEDLLDATVVHTLPRVLLACSSIIDFLGITQILRVGDVIWRVQVGVTAGRRCGILFEGSCVESAPSWINSGWRVS